ncbi:hypothetical protein B484DRAFT_211384 [Ochromonadaceae sp. CCMP2298]|nr:hypothetical protein B484DRAFT_211384 [Ochromonadaceae sp. CCMP2298]
MRSSTRSQSPGIRRGSPALKQFLHREDSQSPGIRRGSPERARSMSPALKHYLHLDEGDYIYTPPAQVPPRSRSASPASYRQMRQAESSTSEALFPASAHTNASEQEDRSYEEEDEFRSSLASDHTLDFADEIEDLTTMDFKAMRLLVLTARHAKDLAVERAAALEMQMSKVAGSEKWNVAFTIVRRAISNYISDKFRAFHRWKHAVLGYHIHIQLNKHNSLVLKLALKSANKSHTMARAKAFTRWVLNSHRAREGASFSLQKIKRCRRILCLGWCRRAIAQWRQFVGAGYQQRLKSATLKAFLNRGQRSIREKKQQAVARWRGAVMGMKLKGMVNKRVVEVMRRFCSKEHDAFELWRRLVFVDMPKMQKVTGRFFELLSKCGIYHTRRAFNSWRSRVQGMIKCARKALEYMDNNVQWRMKAAFTCWTGLLRQHDKLQAMGAATTAQNRLKRQFLLSAGLKHRTACRSSLASRFHYWTFVTQAERFTHKVQQVHDFKIRGMEAQQEEMAQERAHMQQQLVDSKLKSVGRIIHTMLIAAVAKGFKQWLHVHRWHAHREAIHSVVLIDKRRRAQATLVRWMHRTHMVSLSFAMALWRFISTKESLADQILLRQRTRTFRTILQGWREVFRKRTLQRRVLRRMWRAFTEDLKGMAWEVWASKVRHLDAVSRQMGRLVVRKRAAFVRLAVNRWKGILLSNKKVGQQTRINSFERKHQKLCLRMEWQHWRSAFKIVRSKKQHVKQLVINKITQIIRHYLSRWHRQAVFLTRLQKACKELLLASLRATGRAQALAFSRWKFFVLEHTRAHLRSFTERHDQLQMNEQHLRGHNERADRIARTLYTQVNRMLVNRRTTYLLKSTFGAWKEDHLTKQHIKTRFRRFLLQSTASVETKELASAFRTWNVHAHHLMRDEEIIAHMHQTHREHLRRNTFVQWRSFTRTYRIHKRAVLTRIVFNATSQSAKAISSAFNTWKHNIHRHLSGQTLLLNKYFREWLSIVRISNKRNAQLCMVLHRSGLRLLACGVAVWKEASRKIGLVDEGKC